MNGRGLNVLKRHKSIDYEFSQARGEEQGPIPMCSSVQRSYYDKPKYSQLKWTAIYDDEDTIRRILKNETDDESVQKLLSMPDERGQPCIFYALESRSMKAMKCLLDYSKNRNCIIATNGESILHVATRMGCAIDVVRDLLAWDIVCALVDHVEKENGQTPLHIAAKCNYVEIAKEFLLHGAKVDRQDSTGSTPIFTAASNGHAVMLNVFLQYGGRCVESLMLDSDLYGPTFESLFQVAADSGDQKTVQVCLDQNTDIVRRCLKKEMKHGKGILIHSVCKNGMEECLLKIVDAMDDMDILQLSIKDSLGVAPIHKAAINDHVRLVKYLSSISTSFVNETTEYSQTALVLAAHRGHMNVIEELLRLEADFQITDKINRTVLHYGISFPNILRTLLKKKDIAEILLNAKEKDGYTPVHTAALKGLGESLKILVEFGANMNVFTNSSRSPLHCAVISQHINVVRLVLLHNQTLVNKADATGKTPLHSAAHYGSVNVVKCLLDYGALIIRDGNMHSPLHIAALKGHLDVVETLVAFNKKIIDWKNKYGRTALIAAASTGKTEVVKFLLEHGASITEDHDLLNCLDWCLMNNDKDTAMLMMLDTRWNKILTTTKHGSELTMAKLVIKMPEVASRILSNSMTSQGHPDTQEYVKRYDFVSLQDHSKVGKLCKMKPMTAIEAMIKTKSYSCLCHPVCCKFLKEKWLDFGWRVHAVSLLLFLVFLVALNIYAFQIPVYKKTQANPDMDYDTSFDVKGSMAVCFIFASLNVLKEILQLIFYKHRYFLDPVNYMEWIMYICVFIFASPTDQKIAVKTSLQWKACSVALLLAWINLVLYLRRIAAYGVYILMMEKICMTLIKVLSLLILFFVAFAAAFTPIMNDKPGFANFGLSMLSSAVMTTGEIDFKETFLDEADPDYETFHWLKLALLVAFLVLMPVILMNLILALVIGDTTSIMNQAKIKKHIETAKMIIDLERKRFAVPSWFKPQMLATLEERPNKPVHILRSTWEYVCYGPDLIYDEDTKAQRKETRVNENVEARLVMIVDMMKEMQDRMTAMQKELADTRETHDTAKETTKSGGTGSEERSCNEQKGSHENKNRDSGEDFFPEELHVEEEKDRENDKEFMEIKELYKKIPDDIEDYHISS